MGNGYKGVRPMLTGVQKLYLELAGIPVSSVAYEKVCEWYEQKWGVPRDKAALVRMQGEMLIEIFPEMMGTEELAEYLRQVLTGDQAVWAELVIQRYGQDDGKTQRMTELAPKFAREHGYSESTVKTMMGKVMDILRRDVHFREALTVPELSDDQLNYWKFTCILLTGFDRKVEDVHWNEEEAIAVVEELKKIGVNRVSALPETVENWLSTLPKEVRLATKMMYGLGYPAIGRADDYIMAASGFDLKQRSLQDFLKVKLNRSSLCAIFGAEVTDVDYYRLRKDLGMERAMLADVETLGLPLKVATALRDGGVRTAYDLLALDMNSEDEQPWAEHVPSKYWKDIVQLWIDLKIQHEKDEYQFDGGGYEYQNVS